MTTFFNLTDLKDLVRDGNKILISNGNIYNVTLYYKNHPGGYKAILNKCLKISDDKLKFNDCSKDFDFHRNNSKKVWDKYKIGELDNYKKVKRKSFCCF